VHLLFLLALTSKGELPPAYRADPEASVDKWANVPTRLDGLVFYLRLAKYSEPLSLPKADVALPLTAGLVELVRLVLILMLLSCLARAAGDEELSHTCTRAAGVATFGPGAMAVVTLLVAVSIVETGAENQAFARVLFTV